MKMTKIDFWSTYPLKNLLIFEFLPLFVAQLKANKLPEKSRHTRTPKIRGKSGMEIEREHKKAGNKKRTGEKGIGERSK